MTLTHGKPCFEIKREMKMKVLVIEDKGKVVLHMKRERLCWHLNSAE